MLVTVFADAVLTLSHRDTVDHLLREATAMATFTPALVAASVSALLFALKAVSIGTGRDAYDDPLVNLFFYLGIAGLVVTFGLTGAALMTALLPSGGSWVWAEVNLWVIAVLTLAIIVVLRSRASLHR